MCSHLSSVFSLLKGRDLMFLTIRLTEVNHSRLLWQDKNVWASTTIFFPALLLCRKQQQQEVEGNGKNTYLVRGLTLRQVPPGQGGILLQQPGPLQGAEAVHLPMQHCQEQHEPQGQREESLLDRGARFTEHLHAALLPHPPLSWLEREAAAWQGKCCTHSLPAPQSSAACPQGPRAAAKVSDGTRTCSRTVADHSTVTRDWNNCYHLCVDFTTCINSSSLKYQILKHINSRNVKLQLQILHGKEGARRLNMLFLFWKHADPKKTQHR